MISDFIIEECNVSQHFIIRYQERINKDLLGLSVFLKYIIKKYKIFLKKLNSITININGCSVIIKSGVFVTIYTT